MVVDPVRGEVKWWQIGPWLRQHDPEFRPGGKIVVFNNNVYRTAFDNDHEKTPLSYLIGSNIIEIDPELNEHEIIYGEAEGQEMLTVVRGKVELTDGAGLLITEFEGGRVFETDAERSGCLGIHKPIQSKRRLRRSPRRASTLFPISPWKIGHVLVRRKLE